MKGVWIKATAILMLLGSPLAFSQEILRIKQLSATCLTCHPRTSSPQNTIISLQGRSSQETEEALRAYRNHERTGHLMNDIAKGLSLQQIEWLSIYFSETP